MEKKTNYILDRNKLEARYSLHVFSNVFSCNDKSLDLSCAFINLQRTKKKKKKQLWSFANQLDILMTITWTLAHLVDLSIPHQLLHRVFTVETVASKHLDSVRCHLICDITSKGLCDRRVIRVSAALIHLPGRSLVCHPRQLNLHRHLSQEEGHSLVLWTKGRRVLVLLPMYEHFNEVVSIPVETWGKQTSAMSFPKVFLSSAYFVASSRARCAKPVAPAATCRGNKGKSPKEFKTKMQNVPLSEAKDNSFDSSEAEWFFCIDSCPSLQSSSEIQ